MRIFPILLDALFPPRESELLVRSLDAGALSRLMEPRFIQREGVSVIGLLPYAQDAVRACILEAKFHDNARAARLLGAALSDFLHEFLGESLPFIYMEPIVVPLPLSKERLHERGYNQAERIARVAVQQLPALTLDARALRRTRDTPPQTTLGGAERRANLRGAFETSARCDPLRTYIMVDDVSTTGSTMAAACAAMRAGGPTRLIAITLAYQA